MITNKDIIIVGLQPWDHKIGSNCKNLAKEFSKKNRVLYVNNPLNRLDRYKKKNQDFVINYEEVIKGTQPSLRKVGKSIWTLYPKKIIESINKLPHNFLYAFLNKRNSKIFSDEIKRALIEIDFENYILFNDSLMFTGLYLPQLLSPIASIYYIRDNLVSQDYFRKHGVETEPLLSRKYDAIAANSDFLADYLRPHNSNSFMVGQGCDFTIFNLQNISNEEPEAISDIPHPRVGYIGFLSSVRLDIGLIKHIALSKPKYSIILIGPEDKIFKESDLHSIQNVYFLGNQKEHDLPLFINSIDVAINPQAINDLTIGNYPRKIDEYLALGKPVVATKTKTMDYFKDFVYLANNKDETVNLIEKALNDNNNKLAIERIKFAKSHTWENSANKIYEIVNEVLIRKGKTVH
ncbi:MAG: glycosyltransferase [Bacteroidota bacterium]